MPFSSSSSLPTWKPPRTCEDLLLDLQATQLEKLFPVYILVKLFEHSGNVASSFFSSENDGEESSDFRVLPPGNPTRRGGTSACLDRDRDVQLNRLNSPIHPDRRPPDSLRLRARVTFTGTTEHRAGRPLARLEALSFCGLHGRRLSELHGRARTAGPGRARGEAADEDGASWCARLDAKESWLG